MHMLGNHVVGTPAIQIFLLSLIHIYMMVSITAFSLLSFALATWVSFWTWAPPLQSSNKLAPANIKDVYKRQGQNQLGGIKAVVGVVERADVAIAFGLACLLYTSLPLCCRI